MATRARTILKICNVAADWTGAGLGTGNIALGLQKFSPAGAISFDKLATVAQAAAAISAAIDKNLISPILYRNDDLIGATFYLPSITDISLVAILVGTSSSANVRWQFPVGELQAGWNSKSKLLGNASSVTGVGWNMSSIRFIRFDVFFKAPANVLGGILLDQIYVDQIGSETVVS